MFIIKSGCWESLPLPVFEKRQNLSALLLEDRVCPWSGASSREKKLDARSMLCFVHTRSGDVKLPFPFFSFSAQEKGNYAGNETEREAGKLYGGDGQTHKTRLGGGRLMRLNVLTRLSLSSFSLFVVEEKNKKTFLTRTFFCVLLHENHLRICTYGGQCMPFLHRKIA